jgi:uncharacterized integral membrane protein (TIGR00697 family)
MFKDKAHSLFLLLGGFFITNALVAEFIGIKIFSLEATLGYEPLDFTLLGVDGLGFNMTAGVLLWPVVFIMTDIINEYYGKKGVKMLSYLSAGLIIYAFLMIYAAIQLSPNTWWDTQSGLSNDSQNNISSMNIAYSKILGQGLWIIVGSLVAFLVGQILDVFVFHKIKQWTGESRIWLRATGSTFVSQFIDSYVVLIIAFYIGADWDLSRVLAIGSVNYIYKFALAILLTPLIYFAHYMIEKYLGHTLADKLKKEAITT